MIPLRKPETQKRYDEYLSTPREIECPICHKASRGEFEEVGSYLLMQNDFPYDLISQKHVILTTKDHGWHVPDFQEFLEIKAELLYGKFDIFMEVSSQARSVRDHYHAHFLKI